MGSRKLAAIESADESTLFKEFIEEPSNIIGNMKSRKHKFI